MDEPLMTVEEVSVMLNISEQTIRRYIRSKELNAIKFKRSYRITRDDLNRFIKERYGRWVIKIKFNLSIIYYIYEYKIEGGNKQWVNFIFKMLFAVLNN